MLSGENEKHTTVASQKPSERQPWKQETRGMSPLLYELFVLGELMVQPTYGYKLHENANRILGPLRPLSWGTLYPLIRRLEQEGLTTASVEKRREGFPLAGRGQPRRVYTLTSAGKQRFFDLMLTSAEYSRDTPELFFVKLARLQLLAPVQRISVLQWYRRYVFDLHRYYQASRQEVLSNAEIPEGERPFLVQLLDYRYHTLQAELSWLDNRIALGMIALLTVRGRKSGQPRTTPVGIVELNGKRYLIATFGVVNWVRNLRAMGEATLTYERRSETITVVELPPETAAPILKECLVSRSSIARLCFDVTATSSLQEFEREAPRHPVFQVHKA